MILMMIFSMRKIRYKENCENRKTEKAGVAPAFCFAVGKDRENYEKRADI